MRKLGWFGDIVEIFDKWYFEFCELNLLILSYYVRFEGRLIIVCCMEEYYF